jgi:hypothetical protein
VPRYFFYLTNGDSVADEVGEEFDRVEAARGHAMEVARELSRHRLPEALIGRHISVVDERGTSFSRCPYSLETALRPLGPDDCERAGGSFSGQGHLIIALRKPRQLSATDWIGEAIGQRSNFLSAGVPALRARQGQSYAVILVFSGMPGMIPARAR